SVRFRAGARSPRRPWAECTDEWLTCRAVRQGESEDAGLRGRAAVGGDVREGGADTGRAVRAGRAASGDRAPRGAGGAARRAGRARAGAARRAASEGRAGALDGPVRADGEADAVGRRGPARLLPPPGCAAVVRRNALEGRADARDLARAARSARRRGSGRPRGDRTGRVRAAWPLSGDLSGSGLPAARPGGRTLEGAA